METGDRVASRVSTRRHVLVSLLWFALYAQWMTVVPVMVPDQVTTMLGHDAANKEGVTGTIIAAGAAVALLVAPLAGALSDRLRATRGRRRPFLLGGVLGSCIGLLLMIPFGPGSSLWLYLLAVLNLQLWWNIVAGPYAGLIPDVVPESGRAAASGWLNIMSVLGTIAGNVVMAAMYASGGPAAAVAVFIAITLACAALTIGGVREPPSAGAGQPFRFGAFVRSFWLDPRAHENFYWVLVTRLLANMGVWSIFAFLLFYLQDVIGVQEPQNVLPLLLGVGALVAIPASVAGVRAAQRHGLVPVVRWASWVMATAAAAYVAIAFAPHLALVVPVVIVFGAGWSAYQAVDWALAIAVLPSGADAGKDMGIWHVSMVLPQIVGPVSAGWLISWLSAAASGRVAYTAAFGVAAAWFILAAALVARVRLANPG
jgi:Na+/melibiose symporter-like transporter